MGEHNEVALKLLRDVVAGFAVLGSIVKLLPAIAAGFAVLWYLVNLYEKTTGRNFSESKVGLWLRKFIS